MLRIYTMLWDAAIASIIMIPMFLYLNRIRFHSMKKTICYWFLAIYFCSVYAVAGLPDIYYFRFHPHFNFRPFAYMFTDLDNTLLNILFFVPLGFSLPVFWKKFANLQHTILLVFFTSLSIEGLQIFTFRATDVNDLMTNTFGTFLGWCLAKLLLHYYSSLKTEGHLQDLSCIVLLSLSVMFFLHPFFTNIILSF